VFSLPYAQSLSRALTGDAKLRVHIKLDTVMNRIGFDTAGVSDIALAASLDNLVCEGIFTHFACADEADKTSALNQMKLFTDFVQQTEEKLGVNIPLHHCSNSAGIMDLPQANMDLVRAGITLYGLLPSQEVNDASIPLMPALSLHSHVVYIKTLKAGQAVSYGSRFVAKQETRVATVPLGYGDGYPRSLSDGKGYVLIRGQKAPILGRVCMDQFMVDVSDIPETSEGDKVTLIGENEGAYISADYLGELSGRFNYELVCDLNQRLPRVYIQNGVVDSCFQHGNKM
jgi:alanine racemase